MTAPQVKQSTTVQTVEDPKARSAAEKAALKELLAPVSKALLLGRVFGVLSGITAIAPYIALVRLGTILLDARAAGVPPDGGDVRSVTAWLIGAFLLQAMFMFIGLGITHHADLRLGALVRRALIARVATAPLAWFTDTNSGRVRKAVQDDIRTLHTLIAHAPVETAAAVSAPTALIIYAFVVDWRLGLLAIANLPVYILIMALSMRGMAEKTVEMDVLLGDVSATAVEFAEGIEVVKAFGQTGRAHRRFADAADRFANFFYDWCGPQMRTSSLAESMISVPLLMLVNVTGGAFLVRSGAVTVPDVLATTLISLVIPAAITVVATSSWAYMTAGASAIRLQETLDTPSLRAGAGAEPDSHTIRFEDVSFAYGDTLAVDHVTMTCPEGTITALVGPSGSGKSTLATMLARFTDPDSGRITLGGVDLRNFTTRQLYQHVSFVLQNPKLLRLSVRENIRLATPGATDEEIWAAAESAHIADEIRALPEGLDTVIGGPDGTTLSGGQSQRIAIARALLADAPVLILDEALAATDPDAESAIQQALNTLVIGRTVLVIAHRPESVFGADQVIRLAEGRITDTLTGEQVTDDAIATLMGQPRNRK
ncbi:MULTISPECIES: ABC transporter ATP-binding protein [unclassified Corynebacterium]|uniref:ABC transporter ATP-binding protein n=1 Tax=unclassified Corynebacterium TaxID=2624378 RepID=UPI0035244750